MPDFLVVKKKLLFYKISIDIIYVIIIKSKKNKFKDSLCNESNGEHVHTRQYKIMHLRTLFMCILHLLTFAKLTLLFLKKISIQYENWIGMQTNT